MITLALSSSTALVGVAIARDGELLADESLLTDRRHAEEITPMLQRVLSEAGVAVSEIDRIVVDIGPGRYTGMRVGIATAKSLAYALGLPIVPVTSLELIGAALQTPHDGPVYAVVDARRDQVFAQRIDAGDEALVVSPAELLELLAPDSLLIGDGADRYSEQFEEVVAVRHGIAPSVVAAALLDDSLMGVPVVEIEPLYLRDPDAAINIKTRPMDVLP